MLLAFCVCLYIHIISNLSDLLGILSPLGGDNSGQKTGEPGVKNHCKGCKGVLFPLKSGGDPLCCDPHSLGFVFVGIRFFLAYVFNYHWKGGHWGFCVCALFLLFFQIIPNYYIYCYVMYFFRRQIFI